MMAHSTFMLCRARGGTSLTRRIRGLGLVLNCRAVSTSSPRMRFDPARFLATIPREASSKDVENVDAPRIPGTGYRHLRGERPTSLSDLRIGFLGWGAMAQAVSLGILRQGLTKKENMQCTDVMPQILEAAAAEGITAAKSNKDLVEWADIVMVAVKPQVVDPILEEIAPFWTEKKLLVSICAGVTIRTYQEGLGTTAKVVRVMPNTPCLVGEAATAYAGSAQCDEFELDLVYGMFDAVGGATHRVPEYLLNAVTGLSGSGPAYVYMMVQALSDAGVHGGLPRKVATSLAAQTIVGAARMVQESGEHPAVLKEAVTSPAGTTIAGVRVLERAGFNSAIIEAVEAARARSEALSAKPDFLFRENK